MNKNFSTEARFYARPAIDEGQNETNGECEYRFIRHTKKKQASIQKPNSLVPPLGETCRISSVIFC